MFKFVALKDFYSPEFKSQYVEGLTYTVRPGNDKLAAAFKDWEAVGRVKRVEGQIKVEAKVSAVGKVN